LESSFLWSKSTREIYWEFLPAVGELETVSNPKPHVKSLAAQLLALNQDVTAMIEKGPPLPPAEYPKTIPKRSN
jgi:hypothetical protein